MFEYLNINSIPKAFFAHEYSSNSYNMNFSPRKRFIEITYFECGEVIREYPERRVIIPPESVAIEFYDQPMHTLCNTFHRHHTVAFDIDYECTNSMTNNSFTICDFISVDDNKNLKKMIQQTVYEFTTNRHATYAISGLILRILSEFSQMAAFVKQLDVQKNISYSNLHYVNEAKRMIYENLSTTISVNDIAKQLQISEGYLSTLFKRTTGNTLIKYINEIKLERIFELVSNKKLTLKKAGETVGIYDANYISRLYKKYYGTNISKTQIK